MASINRVCVMTLLLLGLSDVVWGSPFNISNILEAYPEFGSFNELLRRTGVAEMINRRQSITVLAVDEAGMSSITRQPLPNIERILMVHVLLDYLSIPKLRELRQDTVVTDLLQTTGVAEGQQGFVVVNRSSGGQIMFRAAGQRAKSSKLLEQVFKLPYSISLLHVSDVIIAPGMITRDRPQPSMSPAPASAPAPGPYPSPAVDSSPPPEPPPPAVDDEPAVDSSPPPEPPPPADDDDVANAPADAYAEAPVALSGASASNVGVAAAITALVCMVMVNGVAH